MNLSACYNALPFLEIKILIVLNLGSFMIFLSAHVIKVNKFNTGYACAYPRSI